MTVLHYLEGWDWTACGRENPRRGTDDMDAVECVICVKNFPRIEDARREQSRLEQVAIDVEAVGLSHIYNQLSTENAAERMLREMVGAVAKYLIETRDEQPVEAIA